jgi:exodeoxyribonuclease VII large subunit
VQDIAISPTDFVALVNQTFDFAFPSVNIEGELANFRISKNRWVYFDLKDEFSNVSFFGSVYSLPGPLEDGLTVQVSGSARLHPRFGFSVNFRTISAVGEGSIKKAADLLRAKLEAEGLFEEARKRPLPSIPQSIGLITAASSAAYADFIKILNERWGGIDINVADVLVQGEQSPNQLVRALDYFNQLPQPPDVLVMIRGGGSPEDLAAFNDERVIRAVAVSRIPTLVAVGHESDISLAELAADKRCSTPTNAAQTVAPNRAHFLELLHREKLQLAARLTSVHGELESAIKQNKSHITRSMTEILNQEVAKLQSFKNISRLLDPKAALKRGYALVSKNGRYITKAKFLKNGDRLDVTFSDGKIQAITKEVN